jgi:hypothetical protein
MFEIHTSLSMHKRCVDGCARPESAIISTMAIIITPAQSQVGIGGQCIA